MEKEVSKIFGFRWNGLDDKQFKRIKINLTSSESSF